MNQFPKILSLSIIGVLAFVFFPYVSVEAASVDTATRCARHEGSDRYERCVDRVNKHVELKNTCGELTGEERRTCAKNFKQENMPAEVKEFKAKIEAACGVRPDKDSTVEQRQSHRACVQNTKQELKDAGEFVPNKKGYGRRGKGHAFGLNKGSRRGGAGLGRGFGQQSQNLPEDVQSQIQQLMEQIRALIEQNQN